MVLHDGLYFGGRDVVATHGLPLGGVELLGGEIGEIDLLEVDEVEAIHIEHIAYLAWVDTLDARDGGPWSRNLERIGGGAVCGLETDLILQVAVEGGELETFVLGGNGDHHTVVGIHRGVEIHLLVVDIDLLHMSQVLADDGDERAGAGLGEGAVGLGGIAGAHGSDDRCAHAFLIVLAGGEGNDHERCHGHEQPTVMVIENILFHIATSGYFSLKSYSTGGWLKYGFWMTSASG